MTTITRRAGMSASAATAVGLTLAACAGGSAAGSDWDSVEDGDLRAIVPSGWDRSSLSSGLWGSRWVSPKDPSGILLTAAKVSASSPADAVDLAMHAARATTRGFLPVGTRRAVSDGSTTLVRQDYSITWPHGSKGAIWAVSNGGRIALVDFSGEGITSDQLHTLGRWIELT